MRTAALRGLLASIAVACAFPVGATAEQASQPASAAAGGLDVGRYHACARLAQASLRCWGYGGVGALGYAATKSIGLDETPAAAGPVNLGAGRTARALSAGWLHTCAVLDDASVRCWGYGGDGRLGYGSQKSIGDDEAPAAAGPVNLGAGRTARAIAAGRAHSCAVLDDGSVRCFGFGFDGRLGYGHENNIGDDELPGSVAAVRLGTGRTATAITAGDSHTCALLDDANVRCWGFAGHGQLGYGNNATFSTDQPPDIAGPVRLGGLDVRTIRDVAWRTPGSLALLTAPSPGNSQVVVVKVDGSSTAAESTTDAEIFSGVARELVTSPALGAPLYIRSPGGQMFALAVNGRWTGAGIRAGIRSPTFVG